LLGNVKRVKHAFTLGARKLRDVLSLPGETMGWRLEKFFGNSLERNGKGQRQDVNDPVTAFGTGRSELSELSGDFEGYFGRLVYGQMYHSHREASGWDVVRHLVSYRKKEFYLRSLNGSTSVQPLPLHSLTNGSQNMGKTRGTGTYIPDMVCDFSAYELLALRLLTSKLLAAESAVIQQKLTNSSFRIFSRGSR